MNQPSTTVVGLGEILWDCFPDSRRPGGAPANVAFHAGQLGADGVICSRVGEDALGQELLQHLRTHGLSTEHVAVDPQHETSRATIEFDEQNHHSFTIHADCAWDYLSVQPAAEQLMQQAAAISFGTLAQRSETARETIHHYLGQAPGDCLRVFDVNLRAPWYDAESLTRSLQAADVLKLNNDELAEITRLLNLESDVPADFVRAMQQQFHVGLVCITRGSDGCILYREGETAEQPGLSVQVADTVGAGDSFSAALIYGLLNNLPLDACAQLANQVAALVASHEGAMPDLREEFAGLKRRFG